MKRVCWSLLPLLFAAATASAQSVRYNFDKQTDFAKFKTYKWVVLAGGSRVDDMRDKQIRDSVDSQLATKGLTKASGEAADLYVTYQAAVDKEKGFNAYTSGDAWGYGPGWGYGGWYGGMGMSSTWTTGQTTTIYVGQLAIDVYDSTTHTLIWRGVVSKTLDAKAKPEKQQKHLDEAVAKLLTNYPPRAKS